MPKKTKRHIKRDSTDKKVPRISVMEQQKKRRSKLYLWLSVGATAVIVVALIIGAIVGGGSKAPDSELANNHFKQKDGYFEMDVPGGWIMNTSLVDTAPYGLENCQAPYLFKPVDAVKNTEKTGDSATNIVGISPNNILCAVFTKDAKVEDIEKFLTGQNIISEQNIVQFFESKGKLMGTKIENANAWLFGDKPMKELTSGSIVAYIQGESFTAYLHGRFDSEATREAIIKSFKSIQSKEVEPANLAEYADPLGFVKIPTPEGWKLDTTTDTLRMHQIIQDAGAIFYPAGSNNKMNLTPEDIQNRLTKDGKKIDGTVQGGISLPMPLRDYLSVYVLDKDTSAETMNGVFKNFIGFGLNNIEKPYTWIVDSLKDKGTAMESCSGKYFIGEPIQIMGLKPVKSLFGIIEAKDGKVLLMGGWTNDGIKKIIIDTLNKITAAPKSK